MIEDDFYKMHLNYGLVLVRLDLQEIQEIKKFLLDTIGEERILYQKPSTEQLFIVKDKSIDDK